MYFKVAPRQTISAAVLPKVRTPLVLHYSQGPLVLSTDRLCALQELCNGGGAVVPPHNGLAIDAGPEGHTPLGVQRLRQSAGELP